MSNNSLRKNPGFASATEVARLAGVSRSAVSRTFTPGRSVSEDTRRKVLAAAEALNYHVNHLARGLSREESRPVCILGGNLSFPWQASLLDHLTRRLHHAGRAVMVINTDDDEASAREALQQTLNYRSTATIVLSGKPPASLIELCLQSGQQVIAINRMGQFPSADNIDIDYSSTMKEALDHLMAAQCRRLAIVSSSARSPSMITRETRFLAAKRAPGSRLSAPAAPVTRPASSLPVSCSTSHRRRTASFASRTSSPAALSMPHATSLACVFQRTSGLLVLMISTRQDGWGIS